MSLLFPMVTGLAIRMENNLTPFAGTQINPQLWAIYSPKFPKVVKMFFSIPVPLAIKPYLLYLCLLLKGSNGGVASIQGI